MSGGPGPAPSWPQLAGWMVLARPARLSGRWRQVDGRRETAGTFVFQSPDTWLVRDARGRRTEHFAVRHLLQPQPFERDDYHRPVGTPRQATHDGRACWQVDLEPPPHKRGLLTLVVDPVSGLCVQQRNDDHGDLVEVLDLQVDGDLDPDMLQEATARRAKQTAESDLYNLVHREPPPTPAWFPWRRGWADKDDCWIVEANAGGGSVGRAPLGEPAPVGDEYEEDERLVVRLDHGGYSWAVAADPPLTAEEARKVVEATEPRDPADDFHADADARPGVVVPVDPEDNGPGRLGEPIGEPEFPDDGDRDRPEPQGWDAGVEAFCVTFTDGVTEDELLDVLQVDRSTRVRASIEDLLSGDGDHNPGDWEYGLIQVDRLGDWWMIYEYNGFLATTDDITARLSVRGRAVTLYRSVNADMDLIVAEKGRVRRRFDPLLDADDLASPDLPGPPLPEEQGLSFGVEGATTDSIALIERLVGHPADPDWVQQGEHDCYIRPHQY